MILNVPFFDYRQLYHWFAITFLVESTAEVLKYKKVLKKPTKNYGTETGAVTVSQSEKRDAYQQIINIALL